jgi:hypothetical protein
MHVGEWVWWRETFRHLSLKTVFLSRNQRGSLHNHR